MTELKTLKDLKKYPIELKDGHETEGRDLNELKAEAVKWYHRSDGNKHKFIMEFFNITEEDLK